MSSHSKANPTIKDFLSFAAIYPFIILFSIMPFKLAMIIGHIIGTLVYYICPYRKDVMTENIKRALGKDTPPSEIDRIIKKVWQNSALCAIEFVKMPSLSKEKIISLVEEVENEEYFEEAGKNGGYVIVTGHIGNWELMGAYHAMRGLNEYVLVKFIHNPYIDKFVNDRRRKLGYPPIYIHEAMKKVITAMKDGHPVVFVADQDARKNGIFVDFFGTPASTFTGPAFFHVKAKVPILPAFGIRTGLTTHKVIACKPIYLPEKINVKEYITTVTQEYTKVLEDIIKKYPDQYFWFHKRWKTKQKQNK